MTKEELEKEANKYAKEITEKYVFMEHGRASALGYLAGAEPREKRIAELERKLKVETELSNRLGLAYREYEQLTKEQDEHLAKLEKENAELRDKLNKIERKCRFNFVDLLHDVENESKQEDQLTKAKELLKEFVHHYKAKTIYIENMQDLLEQSEQFLNSEVEK